MAGVFFALKMPQHLLAALGVIEAVFRRPRMRKLLFQVQVQGPAIFVGRGRQNGSIVRIARIHQFRYRHCTVLVGQQRDALGGALKARLDFHLHLGHQCKQRVARWNGQRTFGGIGQRLRGRERLAMRRFQKHPEQHRALYFAGDVNEMLQMRQSSWAVVLATRPGLAIFLLGNRRHVTGLDGVQFYGCHTRHSLKNNVRDCAKG